jgi:ketosteroid isomerase-like protein
MTVAEAGQLFERRRRAWLAGDLDAYLDLWAEDMTFQSPLHAVPLRGRAAFAELVRLSAATAAPRRFDVHHLAVEGNMVLAEWTIAIERRDSGMRIEWTGMSVAEIRDVDAGLAVGFGVQGAYVFPRAPAWAIGGSFDYLHWSADFENGGPSIDWNEFQLAPAVSYRIPSVPEFTPYAGLMFDFVDARDPLREDDPVGFLVGTNIDPTPNVRLDIQVRAVSELGFFFSAGYLF